MERAYDFHELLSTANTINRLSAIEYGSNGLKFKKVHNKMENVWGKLHPLSEGEIGCNLGDYSLIESDEHVVAALKEGLKEAQAMIRVLNMAPSSQCTAEKKTWFYTPWLLEKSDPKHMSFTPGEKPIQGEDGDAEVLRSELECTRLEELLEEGLTPTTENAKGIGEFDSEIQQQLEDDMGQVVNDMLNSQEVYALDPSGTPQVVPLIQFSGHTIYKSTLVSQLNGNPFLSKDRLTRVKNSIFFNNSDDYVTATSSSTSMLLGLGSDCGVYFVQRSTTRLSSTVKSVVRRKRRRPGKETPKRGRPQKDASPTNILEGVDEGRWWIGRVQKIRRKVGNSWMKLTQPIDLQNRHEVPRKRGNDYGTIEVMLTWFSKHPGHLKFKYDHSDFTYVDIDSIISTVTMSFEQRSSVYLLDPTDATSLDEFVSKKK